MEDTKSGNRNNIDDRGRIREMRAMARRLIEMTLELEPDDEDQTAISIVDKAALLAVQGEAVKATRTADGVSLGGYLIRFGGQDLDGEYFAPDTDYGIESGDSTGVYFHHGMNKQLGGRRLSKAKLTFDEAGIFAETVLHERDEYEKFLVKLAEAGKLGWSSGTASHLMEREAQDDGRTKITRWPIAEASLTHTPAEPGNGVRPLKAAEIPLDTAEAEGAGGEPETKAESVSEKSIEKPITGMEEKMEIDEKAFSEMMENVATKAAEAAIKAMPATTQAPGVVVTKDAGDQPFKSAGEFFQAVKNAAVYPSSADARLSPFKASGMSEGVPADGGYLVSPTIAAGIVEKVYSTGAILSRVAMDPVGANSNAMTYNAIDETSRVDGSRFGGLQAYWLAEGGSKTGSKPKFRQVELKLKKIAALAYATDELLADATALGAWLSRTVPNEIRFRVEDAFINGDGVGKPLGILNSPALVSQLRYATSGIAIQDVVNMRARRYVGVNDYVWLVNQDAMPQIMQLTFANQPAYFNAGGLGGPNGNLLGYPIIETEYNASMGTVGDILLVSLSQYQAIQKGGIEQASSIHVQFLTDETVFRFVYRVDGAPIWHSALTPFKGSNTQSPFVALATATA